MKMIFVFIVAMSILSGCKRGGAGIAGGGSNTSEVAMKLPEKSQYDPLVSNEINSYGVAITATGCANGQTINATKPYAGTLITEKITQGCDYGIILKVGVGNPVQSMVYYSNVACAGVAPTGDMLGRAEFLGKDRISKSVKVCPTADALKKGVKPSPVNGGNTDLDICVVVDGVANQNCLAASGTPSFNGLTVVGSPAVFVIDISGSMSGQKLTDAKKELVKTLGQLDPGFAFNIVSYSSSVNLWKPSAVQAGPSRAEAITFVNGLSDGGGTNTNGALEKAFSIAPTSIYLHTDGEPDSPTSEIIDHVKQWNASGKTAVNTIGFHVSQEAETFLQALANQNNGKYARVGNLDP